MTWRTAVLGPLALALVACSSPKPEGEFADPDVPAAPSNPDGVPYPADHLGWRARVGKTPGDRIANLSFQGYPDSKRQGGLKTVSLADYHDPKAAKYKVIHLQVAASWCSICAATSDETVANRDALVARGAVILQTLSYGPIQNVGPTLGEFDAWIDKHRTNYTVLLDARARRTAPLGVVGVPFNCLIDPRTMEILSAEAGAPSSLVAYIELGLNFVRDKPPSY